MHCSANVGRSDGDVALFFGLSGTGKTTLSADPARGLIGDDEHGWSDEGVFNFEGGCYAKCIRLDPRNEPEIFAAIRFGTVLENVVLDPDPRPRLRRRQPDREHPRRLPDRGDRQPRPLGPRGPPPAPGLPDLRRLRGPAAPVPALTPEQAMYHFLSGYTAKVAGTERGLGAEPTAAFSTCFGAPFMTLPPRRYADLLGANALRRHEAGAWLLNTGWTGGGFGQGKRIKPPPHPKPWSMRS